MYQISSTTNSLRGNIQLPFSKSESNRALIIQHLASQPFAIHNLSDADDTIILQKLLKSNEPVLNCGDGGTTFRFLLACLALKGEDKIITGSTRLCSRPVKPLVDALNQLGALITYLERENFPPLKIGKGDFTKTNSISIAADISSQFISALLMISPLLPNGLQIILEEKVLSKPYLQMTLMMMNWFGIDYLFNQNIIEIKPQQYTARDITISADWSAASYVYEMVALANDADLLLTGLNNHSMQGDKVISELMQQFGVHSIEENNGIRIIKKATVTLPDKFEYDFTDCPDLAQTFAIMCAALNIECTLSGLDNLAIKETNRKTALQTEIAKLGKQVMINDNSLLILKNNPTFPIDQAFKSYHDHRMIMALTPLAIRFSPINIDSINDVSKSFPGFWKEVNKLGVTVSEQV
ncbi:MAG: 3-phosphoshikimate 1-carboxyvinyltransferase [Bacteroidia bacterium]